MRVAVVDPRLLDVAGASALLMRFPDRVEFIDLPDCSDVDVVLYGVDDETVSGHDARLHALLRSSSAVVIAFGWTQESPPAPLASACGVHGFASKELPADQLVAVIEQFQRTGRRDRDAMLPHPGRCYPGVEEAGLTKREIEVLSRIARGRTNNEIADDLYLSINTVKMYVRSAYRKVGASRRSHAVVWATRHGLG